MPCILKQRTRNSPGIVSFTHNEVLRGVPRNSRKVKNFILKSARQKEWVFGVHIQGNCNYLKQWPLEEWQSFILWSQPEDPYLKNVSREKLIPLNCINFMPELYPPPSTNKIYDICILSRPCEGKRIYETLLTLRELVNLRPHLKVTIMAPDPRDIAFGEGTYKAQNIDRRFFELPLKWFSSTELKNFNFICTSTSAFGRFPLAPELMYDQISKSKFLFSTSLYEGVPRAFAEAFMLGVPVAISKNISCGMTKDFNETNSLRVEDDPRVAARQIHEALNRYAEFQVNAEQARKTYGETFHFEPLKKSLTQILKGSGHKVEGTWYLEDLANRLPCHGKRHSYQFLNNPELFFNWIENVQHADPLDEDAVLGTLPLDDTYKFSPLDAYDRTMEKVEKIKGLNPQKVQNKIRKILKRTTVSSTP